MRAILSVILFCLAALAPLARGADERPNILFCIADDWSWPHAGAYGDKVVKTPVFDRVAAEGVLFKHAHCVAASCTPSRAAILSGQFVHRLEEGGNLWGTLPPRYEVYPDLLENAGYAAGCQGKAWSPGRLGERKRNPAGPHFKSFAEFLKTLPADKPFCYWYGSSDPHRPYEKGSGAKSGMKPEDVTVPPFLPDSPETRNDILDYYFEVQRFDASVGEILAALEASGRARNTIVVITSDNGMPFPRAKANCYEYSTHLPLAIRWPARVKAGRVNEDLVSFVDFAPTYLEAAGARTAGVPPVLAADRRDAGATGMNGKSLLKLLTDDVPLGREKLFTERERHANVRKGDLSYPCRAVRTKQFLYIRNLRPDLWPAGDPEKWVAVGPYGDIDGGPSKDFLLAQRDDPKFAPLFKLACDKRPEEELFDLAGDPFTLNNVAGEAKFAEAKKELRAALDIWMKETADPRAAGQGGDERWDKFPYYGNEGPRK